MNSRLAASGAAILITAATLAAAGGYAVAESSSKGNVRLVACASTTTGTMRLVDPGTTCRRGEEKATWNRTGKPGADGATGATGPKGETGATGARGEKGEQGDAAVSGITVLVGAVTVIDANATFQRASTPVCPAGSLALDGGVYGSGTGVELEVVRPADAAGGDALSDPQRYALYLSNSNAFSREIYLYVTCTTVPDID